MESSNNGDKGKVVPLITRTPRIHARYLLQGHLLGTMGMVNQVNHILLQREAFS